MIWSGPRYGYRYPVIGVEIFPSRVPGYSKWELHIRYRTLFLLAMIPWLITLIRLIRMRVKHAAQIDR